MLLSYRQACIDKRERAYRLRIHKSRLSLKCDCANFWDGNEYSERECHFQDWRNAWQLWFYRYYQGKSRNKVIAIPVADPGEGPAGPAPAPRLLLDQTVAWRAEKNIFGDRPLIWGSGSTLKIGAAQLRSVTDDALS